LEELDLSLNELAQVLEAA